MQASVPADTQAPQLEARLLSKYASLLGFAVPVMRFEMVEFGVDGAALADLSVEDRLLEMWRTRFPAMACQRINVKDLSPLSYPLIWVSADSSRIELVRAGLTDRLVLDDNKNEYLTHDEAKQGQLIKLSAESGTETEGLRESKTASEWFASAVRAHRGIFFDAIVATFLISAIGLASAMYTMQVYDRVVPTKGYSTLTVLTVGVGLAMLLELMSKQIRSRMVDRACKAIDEDLSSIFFGKALDIRLDQRPRTVGTFASQIRHFESVRNFMTSSTLFIFADAPFAIFFIGVIAWIGGQVALVPLVLLPLSILVGMAFRRPIEKYTEEHMEESNLKNGLLIEAIDGIESVKSVNGEWKLLDRWRKLTGSIAESDLKMKSLSTFASNITQTLQQGSYVGIIAVGAYLITTGEITMGALIACSIIGGRALAPLAQIPNLIVQWKHAKIALDALDKIMELPGERDPDIRLVVPEKCTPDIKADGVVFGYQPEMPAVNVKNLEIKSGERVAVLGAIGSGKSSLLKLLAGLYRPQQGRMFLDGVDLALLAPEFVREHVGYLPQDVRLFNGTLRDNLTMGLPSPNDSAILEACTLTGLAVVVQAHPKGLDLEITEGGKGLSGGQRQLVGLTRMLLMRPALMLLDEPTASMDAQSEQLVIHHLFNQVPSTSTLIVVTHKMAILPYVDRVVVVDKGMVVIDGPKDAVLEQLKQGAAKARGADAISESHSKTNKLTGN